MWHWETSFNFKLESEFQATTWLTLLCNFPEEVRIICVFREMYSCQCFFSFFSCKHLMIKKCTKEELNLWAWLEFSLWSIQTIKNVWWLSFPHYFESSICCLLCCEKFLTPLQFGSPDSSDCRSQRSGPEGAVEVNSCPSFDMWENQGPILRVQGLTWANKGPLQMLWKQTPFPTEQHS